MNARLNLGTPGSIVIVAAAGLAAVIALGILTAIVGLFQSRGAPMERLVAAERACASQSYVSEREACMKRWLAESRTTLIAGE